MRIAYLFGSVALGAILSLSSALSIYIGPAGTGNEAGRLAGGSAAAQGVSQDATLSYAADLWVDAALGSDNNNGLSAAKALRTIQKAANLAGPGTVIHILPGVYRESVMPARSGNVAAPIRFIAEEGPGTVDIRGSVASSSMTWTQLTSNSIGLPAGVNPTNIYYTDLSAWGLSSAPRFVVELDSAGEVAARLPLAREPDWSVTTEYKYHEFWWTADGGSDASTNCYPPTDGDPINCDESTRSLTQLTDRNYYPEPAGIEAGNLTTLGDLRGAKLVALDTNTGTFIYRRSIIDYNQDAGRITVDQKCEDGYGTNHPALGWGTKYYVEGLPRLLDTPGEWWYDQYNGRLYLWPRTSGNPASMNIEISRYSDGFNLQNRSNITLEGLTLEFYNRYIVTARNTSFEQSHYDYILNSTLRYGSYGVWLSQYVDPDASTDMTIDGFTLEDSEIAYMDNEAFHIYSSWGSSSSAASFIRTGVLNTVIRGCELHHLGFNTDSDGVGAVIMYADHFWFEDNYVHNVAHNGIQLMRSVVQSSKTYGFEPGEIKTGTILIRGNIFEEACQNHTDCGALKISGSPPDRQVFRDLLVTGNIFRNTFGWTYVAEQRGHFSGESSSAVQGMGGFGFYVDNASGIYAYRNIAYNNGFAGFKFATAWRDGAIVYYNNTTANNLYGFHFGKKEYDTHGGSVNTQLVDNILLNNENNGILLSDADGVFENTTLDHNLYYYNGWRVFGQSGDISLDVPGSDIALKTLSDIQAGTSWEDNGVEDTPKIKAYNINDHDLYDGSWPDFHLTTASVNAIDQGVTTLPAALTALLARFNVFDPRRGAAFDIGRYEAGFALRSNPSAWAVQPGGIAYYTLSVSPFDTAHAVTLTVTSPSPDLDVSLEPQVIEPGSTALLTVVDNHPGSELYPGALYDIQVDGEGSGFNGSVFVQLLVGGRRQYMPLILRQ
ncbi:MAG: DUF1565 domain-containing protein [Chloroflexi bacterium]|nr:DUF1565 domain-containing protein [Chloroflexota bacterium]